jgi:hypothetical protein
MIMNDVRLRGFAVAGSDAAGRKTVHNHAQIARNLRRSLRNGAAGARLIQTDGLDSKSAAESQPLLRMHSQSYTGWSFASTDEFDGTFTLRRAQQLATST